MTDETTKAKIPDLVMTAFRVFANELLDAGTLETHLHRTLQLSLARLTSTSPFSFTLKTGWSDSGRDIVATLPPKVSFITAFAVYIYLVFS